MYGISSVREWRYIKRTSTFKEQDAISILKEENTDAVVVGGFTFSNKEGVGHEEFRFLNHLREHHADLPRFYVCRPSYTVIKSLVESEYETKVLTLEEVAPTLSKIMPK